jgi:NAD-dependent dihydropyrimidine dehydrogenase PreA subunit
MINKLFKSKLFPLTFQIFTLIVFVFLVVGAIGITTDSGEIAKQLRNTNLSNLIVWSYWWPLIIIAAVFFGRQWCTVCPIELLTWLTTKFGLKRTPSAFIKSGWIITILYSFVAVVAIHTWGIHRIPNLMAYYLISLFGLAILVSLLFRKRAFCSYFCPVGKLLGLYSILSPFGLRVQDQDTCKKCMTKDCISNKYKDNLIGRSCQSELYPANIKDNRDCILCSQCVKVCPNDNIKVVKSQKPYLTFDLNRLSIAELAMIIILIGFVCYEVLSTWEISKTYLLSLPNFLYSTLPPGTMSSALFEGIILFLIIPTIILVSISVVMKLTGKGSFIYNLKKTCGYLLPVVAFGHVFKSLLKTTSRIPFWNYALNQPDGVLNAEKIVYNEIIIHQINWLNYFAVVLGLAGLVFAVIISIMKILSDKDTNIFNQYIYTVIVSIYFLVLLFGPLSYLIWQA